MKTIERHHLYLTGETTETQMHGVVFCTRKPWHGQWRLLESGEVTLTGAVSEIWDYFGYLSKYTGGIVSQSVQSLSRVRLFVTPLTTAHQASLSITNSWSQPKPMFIESEMPSSHLILCCPLLLLPSIFPSIRVFSNESALCIRWPKYWSFSFNNHTINASWNGTKQ